MHGLCCLPRALISGQFGSKNPGDVAPLKVVDSRLAGIVSQTQALFRQGALARAPCSGTKMHVVHTRKCPEQKIVNNYQEIGDKFVVGASTGCKEVNTACTVKSCY